MQFFGLLVLLYRMVDAEGNDGVGRRPSRCSLEKLPHPRKLLFIDLPHEVILAARDPPLAKPTEHSAIPYSYTLALLYSKLRTGQGSYNHAFMDGQCAMLLYLCEIGLLPLPHVRKKCPRFVIEPLGNVPLQATTTAEKNSARGARSYPPEAFKVLRRTARATSRRRSGGDI